jgi:hypothetical protein
VDEIAIDGFETFEWSQYFPFHHNVAVDVSSGYFLYHTDSPLRRKGRMRPRQKIRRSQLELVLGRTPSRAVEDGVRDLLTPITSKVIRSDDHRAYPCAIRSLGRSITHRITSSTRRRDRRNPLWEVNFLDMFLRHSTGAHKRETIAWAKRRQASIEKLAIFQVWRNYVKRRWEKNEKRTPAMILGLADHQWSVSDLLKERLFFEKVGSFRVGRATTGGQCARLRSRSTASTSFATRFEERGRDEEQRSTHHPGTIFQPQPFYWCRGGVFLNSSPIPRRSSCSVKSSTGSPNTRRRR